MVELISKIQKNKGILQKRKNIKLLLLMGHAKKLRDMAINPKIVVIPGNISYDHRME